MGKRPKKRQGHFCWCCGRTRANERFSGRGHRDHVCRDCQKLPEGERDYRQAVRNMDRLRNWDGLIGRKKRPQLDPFLTHATDRIRAYAEQLLADDREVRAERRREWEAEEAAIEEAIRRNGWDQSDHDEPLDLPPAHSWTEVELPF